VERKKCLPLTRKFYLRNARILVGTVFVDDLEIVTLARRCTETVLGDMDIDFFSSVGTRVGKRSRGSSIFPFDVRSTIEIDFSLYSSQSSLRNSVTPVRRRETLKGMGTRASKSRLAVLWASLLESLSNCCETTRKARQEKTLYWKRSLSRGSEN
jgi:hypothetical protein